MKEDPFGYTLVITPTARRQLAQRLPEAAAFAAHEFIVGALLDNPYRLGKRLHHRWTTGIAHGAAPTACFTASTMSNAPSRSSTSPTAETPRRPGRPHRVARPAVPHALVRRPRPPPGSRREGRSWRPDQCRQRPGPWYTVKVATPTGHAYTSVAPPLNGSRAKPAAVELSPAERHLAHLIRAA